MHFTCGCFDFTCLRLFIKNNVVFNFSYKLVELCLVTININAEYCKVM